ncbi:uncharacterized protein LOC123292616 [Chrysoperla carnea]|uniref:uncharacterized protein LOC123292616 n=1 Tax=Chrysoperla carnea TaxID=189513 RepID=UPI001D088303|nr:uncharacterized protein LOC123292616 [Chrysoperla carnea]
MEIISVCFAVAFSTCASLPVQNENETKETQNIQQQVAEPIKETPKTKRGLFGASVLHAPLIHAPIAAPILHAPIAAPILPARLATSYSSVSIRHSPIIHAAPTILHAPLTTYHAPVLHAAPLLHSAPLYHAPILHAPLLHPPLLHSAIHL